MYFFYRYCNHRNLHVLTHCFPTRRSSDLRRRRPSPASRCCAPTPPAARRRSSEARSLGTTPHSSHRSEEHTSELQSLMRISYAVFCLKYKISSIIFTIILNTSRLLQITYHSHHLTSTHSLTFYPLL